MFQRRYIGRLALWAAALPICMGLACLACSDGIRSVLLQHTLAYAVFGVLAGFASFGFLGKRVFAAKKANELLWIFVKAGIAFAVFAVMVACLRYIAEYERVVWVERLLSYRMGFIGSALVTLEDVLVAALNVAAPVFGALWAWAGFALLDGFGIEHAPARCATVVDLVSDAVALLAGVLMWPAWHCVLPRLGVGFLVPFVLVTVFVLCTCMRDLWQCSSWYARGMTMATLGACLSRVGAMVVPRLLEPSLGLSLVALLVQVALVAVFGLLGFFPSQMAGEKAAEEGGAALLSEELEALLTSYGLTQKEGIAHVLKERESSSAQVGEVLGIKAPTVREYQRRARTKLGDEGLRRVREQLRKEELAHNEAPQVDEADENKLLAVSVGFTIVLFALLPLGAPASMVAYADRASVAAALGLVAAWFFLRVLWCAGFGGLSLWVGRVLRIVAFVAAVVICVWRFAKAGAVSLWPVADAVVWLAYVLIVFAAATLVMDLLFGNELIGQPGLTDVAVCVAVGFLLEEAWRVLGGRSFGVEAVTFCVLIFVGILWLLSQMGMSVFALAALSLLVLVVSAYISGLAPLHVAILLCVTGIFALLILLLGKYRAVLRQRSGEKQLGMWATPLCFDALLVLASGCVVGMLLGRFDTFLFGFGLKVEVEEYYCTVLACVVMLAMLGLAVLVLLGFSALNARFRIERLKASMDKDSEKSLREGLVDLGLTERQARVAFLLAEGWTTEEISDELGYSSGTVARDRGALYKMLGVHTRAGLANRLVKLASELWGYE